MLWVIENNILLLVSGNYEPHIDKNLNDYTLNGSLHDTGFLKCTLKNSRYIQTLHKDIYSSVYIPGNFTIPIYTDPPQNIFGVQLHATSQMQTLIHHITQATIKTLQKTTTKTHFYTRIYSSLLLISLTIACEIRPSTPSLTRYCVSNRRHSKWKNRCVRKRRNAMCTRRRSCATKQNIINKNYMHISVKLSLFILLH